ncbi:uncharacterized protein LOC122040500 [Zingiber officinale]|uniref:uncharacterized protein LOC122040500 n=1 Tax=Zingiber officinale TaxID=94328 RepID=UPI001C4DA84B|nr:uncharacterized protein LOC122040500 [Zingiber officinale]
MSWLRSAVHKAVEVSGKNNLTRTVRNYAGTVVQHAGQAVAGGTRIIQSRIGNKNSQSFKQTAKRLEDIAVSCKGIERVQLLQTWLFSLLEIERVIGDSTDHKLLEQPLSSVDSNSHPGKVSMILYFLGDETMNFKEVLLYSQALESVILSMILEAPNEQEVSLLLQIFGHCLIGDKEDHNDIISRIQQLSKAFSAYEEEVLVKRDELLQFAQGAISGLKVNADIARLEYEISKLQKNVDGIEVLQMTSSQDHAGTKKISDMVEILQEALVEVRLCSRLETLLLKIKGIKSGNSLDVHSQKVDKLTVLVESLANSSSKAEQRILDHRHQKEEALNYHLAKANEARGIEKELLSDIARLEDQRDGLEAELKKVNSSLAAASARLKKTREEKDQFDDASNQMIMHLKTKEDELAKSVTLCNVEADIVHMWINFLQDTWKVQSSCIKLKDKQINEEVEKYGNHFVQLIRYHLSSFKDDLNTSIIHISTLVENLKRFNDRFEGTQGWDNNLAKELNPKKCLEEEYLTIETKIVTAFSIVDRMEDLFYTEREKGSRRDDPAVNELFESIEKLRLHFESIERPILEIEETAREFADKLQKEPCSTVKISSPRLRNIETPRSTPRTPYYLSDPESEITQLELEFQKAGKQFSVHDINGWDFD